MVKVKNLTLEYASQCLSYDPETGIFVWKERPQEHYKTINGWKIFIGKFANKIAGKNNENDYSYIKIDKKVYASHQLAFLFMEGKFPDTEVDHINGIKNDNRWVNLRKSNRYLNNYNTKVKKNSASGIKGVFFNKKANLYFSTIRVYGKRIHLGYFKTKEECAKARKEAELKYHGEYARAS